MPDLFPRAFAVLLEHEVGATGDGYVSAEQAARRHDAGGATKYGVSLRLLRAAGIDVNHDGHVDELDVVALTHDTAEAVYRSIFWDRPGYARLAGDVAVKVFDFGVNAGTGNATRTLQRACTALGHAVPETGVCGPLTAAAARACAEPELLEELRREMRAFYAQVIADHPDQAGNRGGWMARADWGTTAAARAVA